MYNFIFLEKQSVDETFQSSYQSSILLPSISDDDLSNLDEIIKKEDVLISNLSREKIWSSQQQNSYDRIIGNYILLYMHKL